MAQAVSYNVSVLEDAGGCGSALLEQLPVCKTVRQEGANGKQVVAGVAPGDSGSRLRVQSAPQCSMAPPEAHLLMEGRQPAGNLRKPTENFPFSLLFIN